MTRRSALSVILAPLAATGAEDKPAPYDVPEAYDVYSWLLPQTWPWRNARATSLVIAAETVSPAMCLDVKSELDAKLRSVIGAYSDLIRRKWLLQRKFTIDKPYTLVPSAEIQKFFDTRGGGWDDYYAAYPGSGGYITLSPVAFNESKTVAVVNVAHHCGGRCGGGTFSLLKKESVVKKDAGPWSSFPWNGNFCSWIS